MRSRLTCSKPAARASRAASSARPGECTRSSTASTCGATDCMPSDTRVKPAARSCSNSSRRGRLRVGLGGDLGVGGQGEVVAHRVEHRGQAGRRPAARGFRRRRTRCRPAGGEPKPVGGQRQLGPQRRQPAVGVRAAQLGGGIGVEVAVAAAGRAERHVDIDAERPARGQRQAGQLAQLPSGLSCSQFPRARLLLTVSANLARLGHVSVIRGTIGSVTAARIFPQRVSLVARRHVDFKRVCTCCCLP